MSGALDQLESIWPPYRGAVLLGTARESQGRVSNARVAVTAGHVALTLEVNSGREGTSPHQPSGTAAAAAAAVVAAAGSPPLAPPAIDVLSPPPPPPPPPPPSPPSPALRLTVLLDAVPDGAPNPGTHQMARFLTKLLEASEGDGQEPGSALPRRGQGVFGEDIPEMLVIEHADKVVLSEFIRCGGHRANHSGTASLTRGASLIFVCIEASGFVRLWKWGAASAHGWRWAYLNSCNMCACREDPVGCRVLTAAIVPEPEESSLRGNGGGSRHRLVWEQEDWGEGAGLGLAFAPASGSRARRTVWSRRITFDLVDDQGSAEQALHQQQRRQDEAGGGGVGGSNGGRSEIALTFSACLLPTAVDALLCTRIGAWMPAGARVYFNHFATGRLPDAVLPSLRAQQFQPGSPGGSLSGEGDEYRGVGVLGERGDGSAFTDSETGLEDREEEPVPEEGDKDGVAADEAHEEGVSESAELERHAVIKSSLARRLYAVHDSTGDLVIYNHPGTVRVLSLPSWGGSLRLTLQCTLDPPPPVPPHCLAVRLNLAVLCDGGHCWSYDLCTGRLLSATAIPRCPSCAFRRRRRVSSPGLSCTCGRRSPAMAGLDRGAADGGKPALWISETLGHLVGILTATQVLRLKLPAAEACLEAMLAPPPMGGSPSPPTVIRYLREYVRLSGTGNVLPSSLLPEVLRAQGLNVGLGEESTGSGMVEFLGHALAAEERLCESDNAGNSRDSMPPWLLLALMSVAQGRGLRSGEAPASFAMGRRRAAVGGGDPAAAAPAAELRSALESRVVESLRSVDRVRALLPDRGGSALPQGLDRVGARAADHGEAAKKLVESSVTVDPATALFEDTLRQWLACRRKDVENEGDGFAAADNRVTDSSARGSGRASGPEGSRPALRDALALAFRCEAAGDSATQEIPFLRFLLEESSDDSGVASGTDRAGGAFGVKGGQEKGAVPSSSTFLCLHLAGNDASPLFEVACRALFHLRPQQLPRFVERLARFRAYADDIKFDLATDIGGRNGEGEQMKRTREHDLSSDPRLDDITSEAKAADDGGGGSSSGGGGSGAGRSSASRGNLHGTSHRRSPSRERSTQLGGIEESSPASADERKAESCTAPGSPSRPQAPSRHTSEESTAVDDPLHTSKHGSRLTPHTSSTVSQEHLPEPPPLPPAASATASATVAADVKDTPPDVREKPGTESTTPAYFARALACLPPADDDRKDGSQRRARLLLLMGARMFTEACKLLRSRAWEGPDGRWRGDRGAAAAWTAAMRLLGELKLAAAQEEERGGRQDMDATAPASGGLAEPSAAALAGPSHAVYGGAPLQFRLAFEDALAETIVADSPDRMETVMSCRPSGLAPVAVVRMVRRAAEVAAMSGLSTAAGGVSGGGQPGDARHGNVRGGRDEETRHNLGHSGSTQTLKKCLLLLLNDTGGEKRSIMA